MTGGNMIKKTIHYCWFGGKEKPDLVKKCIESWKKYCPDFEIKEWNEESFDISSAPLYVQEAYQEKKWAFITDYVRLWAMYKHGGIYMDTDVEVVKSLDPFLVHKGFTGFEEAEFMVTGIMASEQELPLMKELLSYYDNRKFIREDGSLDLTTNTVSITNALIRIGFEPNGQKQVIEGFAIYPRDYFCPLDDATGKLYKSKNTTTIHWFNKSWLPEKKRFRSKITRVFHRLFGKDCFKFLKRYEKK